MPVERINANPSSSLNINSPDHPAAVANVHGLPANVNVLGDRTGVGRFVQGGSTTASATGTSWSVSAYRTYSVTFPVAYASAPRVFASANNKLASITAPSTTGCSVIVFDNGTTISTSSTFHWMAIGA